MTGKGTALVTGATRRIGAAIARALAGDGYQLVLHSSERSREATEKRAAEFSRNGCKTAVVCADLADPKAPQDIIEQACDQTGDLTLLVNNASVFSPDSADQLQLEDWDRHFDVNLRAPVFLASAFARVTHGPDSNIINIADQRVWRLNPQYFSYTLSKSALWTATQTLAQSFAPDVRVNAIGPGPVLPNINEGDSGFRQEADNIPLERAVDPDDIAEAVLYLASATSVTGQMICVDGGQHLAWKTPDVPV